MGLGNVPTLFWVQMNVKFQSSKFKGNPKSQMKIFEFNLLILPIFPTGEGGGEGAGT
jgi:hypothetical protein